MNRMRLIDADAVFPWYVEAFKGKIKPDEIRFSMNDIAGNLDNMPTIEPKTGKWIRIVKGCRGYSAGDFTCSECGGANKCYCLTEYCCNCGAKMDRRNRNE